MLETLNLRLPHVEADIETVGNFALGGSGAICLLGRNGTGKSTLLRVLAGIEAPLEGQVIFTQSQGSRNKGVFSFCPAYLDLAFDLPLKELLGLPFLHSFDGIGEYTGVFQALGLLDKMDLLYSNLSSGFQKLASIAFAVSRPSRVLLLDEPFANLDFDHAQTVMDLIHEVAQEKLVIASCHINADHIMTFDRVLLLGKPTKLGPANEILVSEAFKERLGVKLESVLVNDKLRYFFSKQ